MTPDALVAACGDRLEPLETAMNEAWWNANVDASDAHEHARAATETAYSDALADADTFAAIRDARDETASHDNVTAALTLLEQTYTPHQVEPALRREMIDLQAAVERRFATHRGAIDGTTVDDNDILEILRTSDDEEQRRAAWEASKEVGAVVADDIRRLADRRNEAARRLGYRDHFALSLATSDFDEEKLFATLAEVEQLTRARFRKMKGTLDEQLVARFGVDRSELRPWHYDDPFFQDVPVAIDVHLDEPLAARPVEELAARTFERMGLDIGNVLARSDLFPRPGKNQHAFCIDVDRSGDVRVLCNNVPGERWTETMLHEFGHAVYFEGVGRDLPWLLRTMHMCVTEGVAMRCGRLTHEPDWLRQVAQLPAADVDALELRLRRARASAVLIFARWVLVMLHFERGLYADPDGAHDDRWWGLVEQYQEIHRPDGRHAPDWAAKIHIAAAPVYYHNYLFGEMIASQLDAAFGSLVTNPDAGSQLARRVFAPGASLRWDHLVEHATGAPLRASVLARDIGGA